MDNIVLRAVRRIGRITSVMNMKRRDFLKGLAVGGMVAAVPGGLWAAEDKFIWGYMLKLGTNAWCDQVPDKWSSWYKTPYELSLKGPSDTLRCDDALWRKTTDRAAKVGCNLLLIDLSEGMRFPSHPELAIKGSWSVEKMRTEIARLKSIGLEPVPKLNFSTSHNVWMGDYRRMVSSTKYYQVCADLIRDVAELFDRPRFMHLGFDEENYEGQKRYRFVAVRQGELWWHDLLWTAGQAEKAGMRPWVWSDKMWSNRDEFLKRMPKSVVQSNWYYGSFPGKSDTARAQIADYEALDKAGFDQIPCASNYAHDENFHNTLQYGREHFDPKRFLGMLMAPWFHTIPHWESRLSGALDVLEKEKIGG